MSSALPPTAHSHQRRSTSCSCIKGWSAAKSSDVKAGDIVALTGIVDASIGETIADAETPLQLPPIKVEEPTVRMTFGINTSPFCGP